MENEKDLTQSLLMKQILEEINTLKSKMPNGEIKHFQLALDELKNSFKEIKDDISDLKKKLLDPDDGIVVRTNENTKFRIQEERRYEEYLAIKADLEETKKWQSGIIKAMWIIFGSIIAIAVKVIFGVS
jgi:superfamily I DNA/RNA helicase